MVMRYLIIFILLLAPSTKSLAEINDCEKMKFFAESAKLNQNDGLDDVEVNCEEHSITFIRNMDVDKENVSQDIIDSKQDQYTELHCNTNEEQSLIANGWNVNDVIYDRNKVLITKLEAKAEDCLTDE